MAPGVRSRYKKTIKELRTTYKDMFKFFVDLDSLPQSSPDKREGIARRNRGYLRYLASCHFLRDYDRDMGTTLKSELNFHLHGLKRKKQLPAYNRLDAVTDIKAKDNVFDL